MEVIFENVCNFSFSQLFAIFPLNFLFHIFFKTLLVTFFVNFQKLFIRAKI